MAVDTGEPQVIVRQEFAQVTPVLARPILPPVAVGVAYQIETRKFGATYANAQIVLNYPDLKAGAVVLQPETVVEILTVEDRFDITSGFNVVITATQITVPAGLVPEKDIVGQTQVSTSAGTALTDAEADFFLSGIRAGDVVQFILDEADLDVIKSVASNQPGDYVVIAVSSPTEIEVRGRVPANHVVGSTENYTIAAGSSDVVGLDVDELGAFTVTLTAGTRTAQQIVDDLNADATFAARAVADVFNSKVRMQSLTKGPASSIEFQTPVAQSAHAALSLGEAASIVGTKTENFDIETNGDDRLKFRINAVDIPEIQLSPGTGRTAAQIAAELNADTDFAAEATASDDGGKLRITSDDDVDSIIEVQLTTYGTSAYSTLGLTVGTFLGKASGSNAKSLIKEDNVEYKIVRRGTSAGDIEVSYRARRTDLKGQVFEFGLSSALTSSLGAAVPKNPLAYGMDIMIQNTDLTVLGTAVNDDTSAEFQEAFELLQTEDVHSIVPLTQDSTVLTLLDQHVTERSAPLKAQERIGWFSPLIPLFESRQADRTITDPVGTVPSDEWDDSGALYVTNEVVAGDLIRITSLTGTIEIDGVDQGTASSTSPIDLTVLSVIDETTVRVAGEFTSGTSITSVTYEVRTKDFTKFELAQNKRDLGQTFSNRRTVLVHPDVVEVNNAGTLENVPAYFLACALAGQRSAIRPAQGQSTLSITGPFTKLLRSNKFFSKDQLDTISTGGIWIMTQRQSGAPMQTRRQLTTDVTALEKAELSVTAVADFAAKYLRFQLTPLLGRNNITKRFIERQFRPQIEAVLRDLREDENVGEDTRVLTLGQDPDNATRLIVRIDFKVPPPFNEADITLVIAFQTVTT